MSQQEFNICPKCSKPVPAPFKAHVEALGGCPEEGEMVTTIKDALNGVYGNTSAKSYADEWNAKLAPHLAIYLTSAEAPNLQELTNLIWLRWPGGGAAASAARAVSDALALDLPESEDS